MTQHDEPNEGQHATPPSPETGSAAPQTWRPTASNEQNPPPYQPHAPWPASPQPAPDFSQSTFPPAMPPHADPRQWDHVERNQSAPFGIRPPAPQPAPPTPQPAPARHAPPNQFPPPGAPPYYGPAQQQVPSGAVQRRAPEPQRRPPEAAAQRTPEAAEQHTPHNPYDADSAWSTANAERTGPKQGWRGGMAKIGIKLSKSARELDYDRDVLRIQRKLAYPQNVPILSLKGGVGKSTATVTIGSTLAFYRHVSDVVAFDSATDGSLRRRMPVDQNRAVTSDARMFLHTLKHRAETNPNHQRLSGSEVQVQLYSNSAGLQSLVAAQHLHDYKLEEEEFDLILDSLHNEYMVNLIDMGPDRRVPTFWPAIQSAHALVLVTTPNAVSIDATKRFIDMLRETDYNNLLNRTVLLWNNAAPGKEIVINVDATKNVLVSHLSPQNDSSTCLVDIPLDPHLAAGGEINLDLLRKDTRRQFERAAALLMDKLPDRAAAQHEQLTGTNNEEL